MTPIRLRWIPALPLLALVATPVAWADLAEWNQAEVTKLADQLQDSTRDLWETFQKEVPSSPGGQRQAHQALLETFKQIRNSSRKLATDLGKGGDRDATRSTFERLMMLVRDAREEARKQMVQESTLDKVTVARDALYQLGPYYDEDWEPPAPVTR